MSRHKALEQITFVDLLSQRESWLKRRARNINSTEVAALFGCSPYATLFSLWHEKKAGVAPALEPDTRMLWGTRLQAAIAAGFAEDHGFRIRELNDYIELPDLRMGSSFDYEVVGSPHHALVEVKNVDSLRFREGWLVEDDDIEAPPHIELQIQHQLAVAKRPCAYLAALVGGNNLVVKQREPNEKVIAQIYERVDAFWESIEANRPPEPEFPRDAATVCALYANAQSGKVLDASMNPNLSRLAREYAEACQQEKLATELKKTLQAQMLQAIGDHEKVLGDGFKISAGTVSVAAGVIERKAYSYRNFRLTMAKGDA